MGRDIMLVDFILDRRDGIEYDPRELYDYCNEMGAIFGDSYWNVARALDGGTNEDIRLELCAYILGGGYNPQICDYINSVDWL